MMIEEIEKVVKVEMEEDFKNIQHCPIGRNDRENKVSNY